MGILPKGCFVAVDAYKPCVLMGTALRPSAAFAPACVLLRRIAARERSCNRMPARRGA